MSKKEDEAIRACLGPAQPRHLFLSKWKGNRICKRCTVLIQHLETGFSELEANVSKGRVKEKPHA